MVEVDYQTKLVVKYTCIVKHSWPVCCLAEEEREPVAQPLELCHLGTTGEMSFVLELGD